LFIAFALIAIVVAVPVEQAPAKVEEVPAKVEEVPAKVEEAKVEEAKVEETKVEETKVEEAKVEETKVEETKTEASKTEEKTEDAKTDDIAAIKDQALAQVMNFISEMAQPMSDEEHSALKDIISTGGDILMQAEKKAREVGELAEVQNLMQTGSETGLFGMKADGTIDADAAADQMTELLSKMASPSNPLTTDEKDVLHELIAGFSRAFAPTKETTEALQQDFEKLVGSFVPTDNKNAKADELTGATNLLSMFSDSKQAFDTKMLTDLTEKFLDSMEKQFAAQA
jgi:hypothetical protein